MKQQGTEETITMQKEAENIYLNIKDAYDSGMSYWKEALLVSFRQEIHPMVKDHVKFLITKNKNVK